MVPTGIGLIRSHLSACPPVRVLTEKKLKMLRARPAEARSQKYVCPLQGRPALPEQVAEVMLFLASDESSAVAGQNVIADRGNTSLNPGGIAGPLEEEIRNTLKAQGSAQIQGVAPERTGVEPSTGIGRFTFSHRTLRHAAESELEPEKCWQGSN